MYQDYHNYFQWLCELHPSLLHTAVRPIFEMSSIEEAYADFRGKIGDSGYFFRLIDPTYTVDEFGGFTFKRKQGAAIIAKKLATRSASPADRVAARNACEIIADDFISHMLADSQNGHPLFSHAQDELNHLKINVAPALVIGDGSYDGVTLTFEFCPAKDYTLACHPTTAWRTLSPFTYS